MPGKLAADFNKKTLLVLNTGYPRKRFILERLAQIPNLQVVMVYSHINWAEGLVDDWILVDTRDVQATIKAVGQYLKQHQVDGIVTFWEDDVLVTAKLVDVFHQTGVTWDIASRTRNKFAFREFCRQHSLPAPRHALARSVAELETVLTELTLPVVLKPTFGSSSAFVIKADTIQEALDRYQLLQANLDVKVESAMGEHLELMVEEYIDGDEVDIDILMQDGVIKFWQITDNYKTEEPYFLETGMAIPSALSVKAQADLVAMARAVLKNLSITDACIHFEAKSTKHGPVPIEVNLRMGGDEIYSSINRAWKVDFIDYSAKIALHEYFPVIEKPAKPEVYIAGRTLSPELSGTVTHFEGPENFLPADQIDQFQFFKAVGDKVLTPPVAYEFLGWVTVKGHSAAESHANLAKVLKKIRYEIKPF